MFRNLFSTTTPSTTTTANGAKSLATSENARVDLFFKLTRDVADNSSFETWVENAWLEHPLDTLKLLFHSRDCRGGKGDRNTFLKGMTMVSERWPECFSANIERIPSYGRWLDLVELLGRLKNDTHKQHIARFLAFTLKRDRERMIEVFPGATLLAKWMPSEKKKWDRTTDVTKMVCAELYPREPFNGYVRKKFRTEYLTPLRSYLDIVEKRMCTGEWDMIQFSKVPSVTMHKLRKAFEKNAPDTFKAWLNEVESGKKKINASQVYPHDLVRSTNGGRKGIDRVVEEQWKELVKKLSSREGGAIGNAIAVCDVSGSMFGTPMEVSVALGILLSEVAAPPFKDLVVTFSAFPEFIDLSSCNTLKEKVHTVWDMPWGTNTDLHKVFELVLQKARVQDLPKESMPKRVFIFSDMQFDAAQGNCRTNFEVMKGVFEQNGYDFPEIIFWNLSGQYNDMPVTFDEAGVALLSGYSPKLLKLIIEGDALDPQHLMRKAIDDPRYDDIIVRLNGL